MILQRYMRPFVEQGLLKEPVAQDVLPIARVNRETPVEVVGAEYLGNATALRIVGMRRVAGVHVDLLSPQEQDGRQATESLRVGVHFGRAASTLPNSGLTWNSMLRP